MPAEECKASSTKRENPADVKKRYTFGLLKLKAAFSTFHQSCFRVKTTRRVKLLHPQIRPCALLTSLQERYSLIKLFSLLNSATTS